MAKEQNPRAWIYTSDNGTHHAFVIALTRRPWRAHAIVEKVTMGMGHLNWRGVPITHKQLREYLKSYEPNVMYEAKEEYANA